MNTHNVQNSQNKDFDCSSEEYSPVELLLMQEGSQMKYPGVPQQGNSSLKRLCEFAILKGLHPQLPGSTNEVLSKIISGQTVCPKDLNLFSVADNTAAGAVANDEKWYEFEKSGNIHALLYHAAATGNAERLLSYLLYAVTIMKISPSWTDIRKNSDRPFVHAVCDLFEKNATEAMMGLKGTLPEAGSALYAWQKIFTPDHADESLLDSDDIVAGYFKFQNGDVKAEIVARRCPLSPNYLGFRYTKYLNSMGIPHLPDSIAEIPDEDLHDAMTAFAFALSKNGTPSLWNDFYELSKRCPDKKTVRENRTHAALHGALSALRDWYAEALDREDYELAGTIRKIIREIHGVDMPFPEEKAEKIKKENAALEERMLAFAVKIRRWRSIGFLLAYLVSLVAAAFVLFYCGGQLCRFFDWIFGTSANEYGVVKILLYTLTGGLLPLVFLCFWKEWCHSNCDDWIRKRFNQNIWKSHWRSHRLAERLPERKTFWPYIPQNVANFLYPAILITTGVLWIGCFFVNCGPFLSSLCLFVGSAAFVFVKICRLVHDDLGSPLPPEETPRRKGESEYSKLVQSNRICAIFSKQKKEAEPGPVSEARGKKNAKGKSRSAAKISLDELFFGDKTGDEPLETLKKSASSQSITISGTNFKHKRNSGDADCDKLAADHAIGDSFFEARNAKGKSRDEVDLSNLTGLLTETEEESSDKLSLGDLLLQDIKSRKRQ